VGRLDLKPPVPPADHPRTRGVDSTVPRIPFDALPDDARLWIFGVGEALSPEKEALLLDDVDEFLASWNAHGRPLACARDWRHGRFLLVGVDERTAPPSGCSIDAIVHLLKDLEGRLGVSIVDNSRVWYRVDDEVRRASRPEFSSLARSGEVGLETRVFDGSLTRVGELRSNRWEIPAREAWHARAFFRGGRGG